MGIEVRVAGAGVAGFDDYAFRSVLAFSWSVGSFFGLRLGAVSDWSGRM